MSRDKQIEEMVKAVCIQMRDYPKLTCKKCKESNRSTNAYCRIQFEMERLYNAGYRKSTDVAEEIFAEIDAEICNELEKADDETIVFNYDGIVDRVLDKLKKKYTQDKGRDKIAEFGKYSPLSWRNTEEGK